MIKRIVLIVFAVLAAFYAADYTVLRIRAATNRGAFGSVTVQRVYALHKRRDKVDFIVADPEDQTCVNSLLPHMGCKPCWYLRRHAEQTIDWY